MSWPQPEQPNGIILDYEVRYYEKVSRICIPEISGTMGARPATVSLTPALEGRKLGWAIRWALVHCCFPLDCESLAEVNGEVLSDCNKIPGSFCFFLG